MSTLNFYVTPLLCLFLPFACKSLLEHSWLLLYSASQWMLKGIKGMHLITQCKIIILQSTWTFYSYLPCTGQVCTLLLANYLGQVLKSNPHLNLNCHLKHLIAHPWILVVGNPSPDRSTARKSAPRLDSTNTKVRSVPWCSERKQLRCEKKTIKCNIM